MALFLYRLGRWSFRQRRLVVALWILAAVAMGIAASALSAPTSDEFSIPGTESQAGIDLLEERMPEAGAGNASATVVFTVDDGALTDPANQQAVLDAVDAVASLDHVTSAMDPFTLQALSPDGSTGLANVTYDVPAMELTHDDQEALAEAAESAEAAGVDVEMRGSATALTAHPGAASELLGLLIAAVVLVVTLGSMVAAGMPLLTAILGVAIGLLGIQVATGFFDLSSTTSTLATMLGLAVGVDYALFIISRYRHELLTRRHGEEAAGLAVGTAGSAVVFAGLAVAIALVALTVVGIPFLAAMGIAAAGTVLIAVAIAVTFIPALLGFAGDKVLGRKGYAAHDIEGDDDGAPSLADRWAQFAIRHRGALAIAVVVVIAVVALPTRSLQLGLPSDATAAEGSTQRVAYDRLAEAFGPGSNGPLLVAVDLADAPGGALGAVESLRTDIAGLDGVAAVADARPNQAGDLAIVAVTPTTGPGDAATEDVVHDIRDLADGWETETGATVAVTGETAVAIDVSTTLADALVPYLAIVVGLAFVLLAMVFRSLLVPLKAAAGFLLSIAATFGAVVAVFQWGWLGSVLGVEATGPIISFLPILLIGLLFGLAMDYEVFLVTRMREEYVHGADPDTAIRGGVRHGARVVSAAALIMIAVFGGFILQDDTVIKSIGFALAFGVAVDAFIVRMALVPALMSLLGDRAWSIPTWLDRALPDIDVEGAQLTRHLEETAASAEDGAGEGRELIGTAMR